MGLVFILPGLAALYLSIPDLAEQNGVAQDLPTPLVRGYARHISLSDSQDGYSLLEITSSETYRSWK